MHISRREALKTLALAAGAAALPRLPFSGAGDAFAAAEPASSAAPLAGPPATPPAGPFKLPALPYAVDALEPFLDAQTMQIHHDKHHAAYVNNLNKVVSGKADLEKKSVDELLRMLDKLPGDIAGTVRNHGGGHFNHSLLWTSLKKDAVHAPSGELATAIDKVWGGFPAFQERFHAAALAVFGSGWTWLVHAPKTGLAIVNTPNQDTPWSTGAVPLVGIDVWEHAYYLKFQNRRADYVTAFSQVIDWDVVSERYRDALKG